MAPDCGGGPDRALRRAIIALAAMRAPRRTLRISPERYFVVAAVALVALTLIVFTGAAVRVTGSGLGCPDWPNCQSGRLVAEAQTHAWIEFANRLLSGFVGIAAIAAGLLAFFRRPFRRDLAILGVLLPLGVVCQAVLGGLTVLYGLAPGWVMSHYLLSMAILVACGMLAWRAQPSYPDGVPPQADRTVARWVWGSAALGGVAIFAGTAATAAGPHAGASGTGEVVHRLDFEGVSTLTWLVNRHGALAAALGDVVGRAAPRRRAVAADAAHAHLPAARRPGPPRDPPVPPRAPGRAGVGPRGAGDADLGRARARGGAGRLARHRAGGGVVAPRRGPARADLDLAAQQALAHERRLPRHGAARAPQDH